MKLRGRNLEAASFGPRKQLYLHGGCITLLCFLHRSLLRSLRSRLSTDLQRGSQGLHGPSEAVALRSTRGALGSHSYPPPCFPFLTAMPMQQFLPLSHRVLERPSAG